MDACVGTCRVPNEPLPVARAKFWKAEPGIRTEPSGILADSNEVASTSEALAVKINNLFFFIGIDR
jgi:hypothetical protein